MKRIKSKSGKKRQDISVRWKVSDWVGDLHTDKNNFYRSSKLFDFLNCFSEILYIYWPKSLKQFMKSEYLSS